MTKSEPSSAAPVDSPQRLEAVVPQEELRAFTGRSSEETRSVLIEAQPIEPQVVARERSARTGSPVLTVPAFSARQHEQISERLAEINDLLESLGVEQPVTLRASQVVVASLTAEQLRQVVAHPATGRIVANERY